MPAARVRARLARSSSATHVPAASRPSIPTRGSGQPGAAEGRAGGPPPPTRRHRPSDVRLAAPAALLRLLGVATDRPTSIFPLKSTELAMYRTQKLKHRLCLRTIPLLTDTLTRGESSVLKMRNF